MKHTRLTDGLRERTSLYALGAMTADERRAFEAHLEGGCTACRDEADACRVLAGNLALAAPPALPRRGVRAGLLAAARASRPAVPRAPFRFVLEREGDWLPLHPGVFRKRLAEGPETAGASYLIRLDPGAVVPRHGHDATEHCYVLEGDVRIGGRHVGAGDFHLAEPGSTHDGIRSERGCLLLIVESHA